MQTFLKFTTTLAIRQICTERYSIIKRPVKLPELLSKTDCLFHGVFLPVVRGKIPTWTK